MTTELFTNILMIHPDEQWKKPFSLAVIVHLAVFVLLINPPSFLMPTRDYTEVQTINLFTASEFKQLQQKTLPKAKPAAPKKIIQKPVIKKPEPLAKDMQSIAIAPEQQTHAGEAVSLKPRKIKKKLPPPQKKVDDNIRLKALERIQARINQKKEQEQTKHDLAKLRDKLHSTPVQEETTPSQNEDPVDNTLPEDTGPEETGPSDTQVAAQLDQAVKRYYIAISRKIHRNWALPETQDWDKSLEAVAVIVVKKNGTVGRTFFEKKSKNIYFDQYVEKTLQAAAPFPPFPFDLNKTEIEVGLRFRPSGLF